MGVRRHVRGMCGGGLCLVHTGFKRAGAQHVASALPLLPIIMPFACLDFPAAGILSLVLCPRAYSLLAAAGRLVLGLSCLKSLPHHSISLPSEAIHSTSSFPTSLTHSTHTTCTHSRLHTTGMSICGLGASTCTTRPRPQRRGLHTPKPASTLLALTALLATAATVHAFLPASAPSQMMLLRPALRTAAAVAAARPRAPLARTLLVRMQSGGGGADATAAPPKKQQQQKQKGGGKQPKVEEEPLTGAALTAKENEIKQDRLAKARAMEAEGRTAFATTYPVTATVASINEKWATLEAGAEDEEADVSVAGRIMARRVFGKLAFFTLQDDTGVIQLYLDKGRLGEEFTKLKAWTDSGDIVGVRGSVKRTEKGEISVYAREWTMLTKSLLPLPDKWHGLTDVNKRYRQRETDLIVNPHVKETFRLRAKMFSGIRRMLDDKGFLEIETPILQTRPGGADARPFKTFHNSLDMDLTLRIATELHLKRLVVGGFERVYELGRIFRNEGISTRHNPEFTSIELYQAYSDYDDMMDLTEEIINGLATTLLQTETLTYQNTTINLQRPWRRATMHELVAERLPRNFDLATLADNSPESLEKAKDIARAAKVPDIGQCISVGHVVQACFEELCEADLIQPTFVIDHPVEVSPLAKPHRSKPGLTERFELFVYGRELANAFSELTDPVDQRRRFEEQVERKAKLGLEEAAEVDEEFLAALERGMPPTGGLGIGLDRLVMLFADAPSIKDVIAFPLLRKED